MEITPGMRVVLVGDSGNNLLPAGSIGTAVNTCMSLNKIYDIVKVDWDNYCDGHSCDGLARKGHGWNVRLDDVQPLCFDEDDSVVDFSDLL